MTEPIPHQPDPAEPVLYRLGRKSSLWAAFTPGGHGLRRTWQLAVAARGRGGAKVTAPLLETSVLRPLATVTVKGEAYPLTIDWHEARRGGQLALGGERKSGGGRRDVLAWEMRWLPQTREDRTWEEGAFRVEMRVRTTPRRSGALRIDLASPLYQPELWAIPAVSLPGAQRRVRLVGATARTASAWWPGTARRPGRRGAGGHWTSRRSPSAAAS